MTSENRLHINTLQKQMIFQFAGKKVAATVTRRSCGGAVDVFGEELSQKMILGAFVSLKRNGELRSCMGCLAHELMPLGVAVERASTSSAADDPRFPPISPIELSGLDMEVWLLWDMRTLEEKGRDRLNAIEIGRHGLQISQGARKGLLLPGVAVDHRLDALQFLEAVCQKAGLPKEAWHDDRSTLSVFGGEAISGTLASTMLQERIKPQYFSTVGGPKYKDVAGLCNAARDNFFRLLDGMTPNYYQPDLFDGNMTGIGLSVTLPDTTPMICARNGIKADIPLQSSLVEYTGALVEQFRRIGPDTVDLLQARFDLFLQWDVALHGSLHSYDLSNIDMTRRSLMLNVSDRWAIRYDTSATAEELLNALYDQLDVDDDEPTQIYSFETLSTSPFFELESLSREPIYPKLRPAMLAGSFYPKLAKDMESELNRMFAPGPVVAARAATNLNGEVAEVLPIRKQPLQKDTPGMSPMSKLIRAAAVMVPHAGWVYSGRLAAQTFLRTEIPETVVIFAPKHRSGGANWAVAPYETWGVPFGNVAANHDWASRFVEAVPSFRFDEIPHKQEHAIEVQLPILARIQPNVKIVGVTMSGGDWDKIEEAAEQFADFLKQDETKPLLVISSDMNHFATEEMTRHIDKMALDAMQTLNAERFFEVVIKNRISMCGIYAAAFLLKTLQLNDELHQVIPVGYTTSAEYSGDTQRVVGYAGMLFQ